MRENTIRRIWRAGGAVVNGWCAIPSAFAAETMAHQKWDSLTIDLPDEGLRWGDLAVCRGTGMPAILTESAYVILPDQEERLRQASYQKKLAGSLLEGIRSYLQEYQRLQRRTKAEKSAAHPKQS